MSVDELLAHSPRGAPADLLRRYRTLCEATGLARAARVALAPVAAAELERVERRLLELLAKVEPGRETPGASLAPPPRTTRPDDPPAPPEAPAAHPSPPEREATPAPLAQRAPREVPSDGAARPPIVATVFTDGAAEGNPGPGGYCALVRLPGKPDRELAGGVARTTNNQMELTAAIVGLRAAFAAGADEVTVVSDSEYLTKGMSQWLAGWRRTGWKTADNQPVKNRELWEQLDALVRNRTVRWRWIRGHAGHPENERCDAVATAAARRAAREQGEKR